MATNFDGRLIWLIWKMEPLITYVECECVSLYSGKKNHKIDRHFDKHASYVANIMHGI